MEHFFLCCKSMRVIRLRVCAFSYVNTRRFNIYNFSLFISLSLYFQALITPSLLADKSIRPPLNASPAEEEEEE